MKVHYLNCGTMHPRLAPVFVPHQSRVPCLCLLIETGDRLVLVDSGFGTRDMEDLSRLGSMNVILNAIPDKEQPAVHQVERLDFEEKTSGTSSAPTWTATTLEAFPTFPKHACTSPRLSATRR